MQQAQNVELFDNFFLTNSLSIFVTSYLFISNLPHNLLLHINKQFNIPCFAFTVGYKDIILNLKDTMLLESGSKPKEIQTRLGHSRLATTTDIYTHVTKKMKKETIDIFESIMSQEA